MSKGRLEAFSDGVIAIIITIMVLEMKPPHTEPTLAALHPLWPILLSYVLSFIYVGLYWNNHHHLFHAVQRVNGATLWANLHLLFWLSLIPFVTGWMGENHFATWPVAIYGMNLLMCASAWEILRRLLLAQHDANSPIVKALGGHHRRKELISLLIYVAAITVAFVNSWLACALYALVALIWIVPDRRIERAMHHTS